MQSVYVLANHFGQMVRENLVTNIVQDWREGVKCSGRDCLPARQSLLQQVSTCRQSHKVSPRVFLKCSRALKANVQSNFVTKIIVR